MKTKIASFLSIAVLSLLTLSTGAFAEVDEGFYEKDHIRGFISIGADYRGMRSEYAKYVNQIARANWGHIIQMEITKPNTDPVEYDTVGQRRWGEFSYNKFNDYYLGIHFNIGAQYKQFLTWFDFNFMPPQISERKKDTYSVKLSSSDRPLSRTSFPLFDVEWFTYGVDWMFGWKLLGEDTFINLIPAVGFGCNLINFHFASGFDIVERDNEEHVETLRDRFYSTLATTVTAEMELRIELGRLALGAYGGYRFARYNDLQYEGFSIDYGPNRNTTDNVGDTWYLGLRLTWFFLSDWEKKQADKL
ncbi:hypothetical protein [uncultured Fibrobacter sp.]|uniref:hypothetical protein n=1 Tax=uncultured Fibrobacter sp. TaxID=261512 RepID=UPI00260B11D5|nr:hypothetical protein [uncultured Fibrobacter sp.]